MVHKLLWLLIYAVINNTQPRFHHFLCWELNIMFITLCKYDNFLPNVYGILEDRSLHTTGNSDSDLILAQRLLTHTFKKKKSSIKETVTHKIPMVPSQYTITRKNMHTHNSTIHTLNTHPPTQYVYIHIILYLFFFLSRKQELVKAYQENFNLCNLFKPIFSVTNTEILSIMMISYRNCSSDVHVVF